MDVERTLQNLKTYENDMVNAVNSIIIGTENARKFCHTKQLHLKLDHNQENICKKI